MRRLAFGAVDPYSQRAPVGIVPQHENHRVT
jgi:hypothetical protein